MKHILDTFRVYVDEGTQVEHTRRIAVHYAQMNGPIEDVSDLWDEHEYVTSFQDEFGEEYHVLEPFQKVLDGWLLYLESQDYPSITFSSQ